MRYFLDSMVTRVDSIVDDHAIRLQTRFSYSTIFVINLSNGTLKQIRANDDRFHTTRALLSLQTSAIPLERILVLDDHFIVLT